MPYPEPTKEGFYWAIWRVVADGTNYDGDPAYHNWEVVEVWDNNGDGDETFGVSVPGVERAQWVPDFIWGPKVDRPAELKPSTMGTEKARRQIAERNAK